MPVSDSKYFFTLCMTACILTDALAYRTGSAFSWVVVAPRDKVKIDGDVKTYAKKGDSGNDVHRIFCGVSADYRCLCSRKTDKIQNLCLTQTCGSPMVSGSVQLMCVGSES